MTLPEQEALLPIVLAISQARKVGPNTLLIGRVVSFARGPILAEGAIIGSIVEATFPGHKVPERVRLLPGMLVKIDLPMSDVHKCLDAIERSDFPSLVTNITRVMPMSEPSVKVPLSLFQLLRGQEGITEASRKALMRVWAEDRRTGKRKRSD